MRYKAFQTVVRSRHQSAGSRTKTTLKNHIIDRSKLQDYGALKKVPRQIKLFANRNFTQ